MAAPMPARGHSFIPEQLSCGARTSAYSGGAVNGRVAQSIKTLGQNLRSNGERAEHLAAAIARRRPIEAKFA